MFIEIVKREFIFLLLFILTAFITIIIHELGHAINFRKVIKNDDVVIKIKLGTGKNLFRINIKNYYFFICKHFFIFAITYIPDSYLFSLSKKQKLKIYSGGVIYNIYQLFISFILILIFNGYIKNKLIIDFIGRYFITLNLLPIKFRNYSLDGYYLFKYEKAINILNMIEKNNRKEQ